MNPLVLACVLVFFVASAVVLGFAAMLQNREVSTDERHGEGSPPDDYPTRCPSCGVDLPSRVLRCGDCHYDIYRRNWKGTLAPWLVPFPAIPIVGIILAHLARSDFKLHPYQRGQTSAKVALVLGYGLWIVLAALVIAGQREHIMGWFGMCKGTDGNWYAEPCARR